MFWGMQFVLVNGMTIETLFQHLNMLDQNFQCFADGIRQASMIQVGNIQDRPGGAALHDLPRDADHN